MYVNTSGYVSLPVVVAGPHSLRLSAAVGHLALTWAPTLLTYIDITRRLPRGLAWPGLRPTGGARIELTIMYTCLSKQSPDRKRRRRRREPGSEDILSSTSTEFLNKS